MDIVVFEHLTAEQRAQCAEILREAFAAVEAYSEPGEAEAEIESFFVDPDRFAMAAVEKGRVLGLVGGIIAYTHAVELHPLAVEAGHRGRGIGAALIRAAAETFRGLGLRQAKLGAQAHALGFYAALGFEAVGEVYQDAGIAHRDMILTL